MIWVDPILLYNMGFVSRKYLNCQMLHPQSCNSLVASNGRIKVQKDKHNISLTNRLNEWAPYENTQNIKYFLVPLLGVTVRNIIDNSPLSHLKSLVFVNGEEA